MLFRYDATPGPAGLPMPELRLSTVRTPLTSQLVVTIHPKCPCSRATVGELARVMTACEGRLTARVLMVRPPGKPEGWEQTDLWTAAARIPGVTVVTDVDGAESGKFGAETSGHAMLYDGSGKLVFSGGITESRGHEGDNAGRSAVVSLVWAGMWAEGNVSPRTPVYGCSLFDRRNESQGQGGAQ
jgi:hypothetical protein